jgi:hypothetical protein
MIKFVSDLRQVGIFFQFGVFFPGTLVSSSNKIDRHDWYIYQILLKVALRTISLSLSLIPKVNLGNIDNWYLMISVRQWSMSFDLFERKLTFGEFVILMCVSYIWPECWFTECQLSKRSKDIDTHQHILFKRIVFSLELVVHSYFCPEKPHRRSISNYVLILKCFISPDIYQIKFCIRSDV